MTFKRQIDRLPIIPADAKEHNVTCQFCIVGCGYKAYTWDINDQGGAAANANKFGVDLSKQQLPMTPNWYSPSMYNIVKQGGKDVHIVIKPDAACVVNSGLGSIRGARMAEESFSEARSTQQQRLTEPMVWRYGQMQPTSWDDALDLVARVTAAVIDAQGEDGLFVSAFDHGGAGGGYENTWGTGKLYFGAMKIKNIRIHNRPAYNSEVHATRDMGVGELNNCYEDAELADTIVAVGTNPLETQTNYFLNHWIPNLQGGTLEKKKKLMPNEPHDAARIIFVDPRRTVTRQRLRSRGRQEQSAASGHQLGHGPGAVQRDLHLHRRQGMGAEGLHRQEHAAHGAVASAALPGARRLRRRCPAISPASRRPAKGARFRSTTRPRSPGLNPADIVKAAEWIGMPKEGGARRRVMIGYEKGIIWGNDNYRTNGAIVNVALATGNIGQLGGGVVRLGGHQEGYVRPDYPGSRPAPYVDQLLIEGHGGVHHIWACDHYKTTLNADKFKQAYKKRTDMVKDAMSAVPYGDQKAMVAAIVAAIGKGGLFAVDVDIVPTKIGQACHVWLPAATAGEMNLTSMNGERRLRLTERYMDPPGQAMPDCLIAARLANNLERVFRENGKAGHGRQVQGVRLEDRGGRLYRRLSRERQGRRIRHLRSAARHGHQWRPGAGDGVRRGQARRHAAALHRWRVLDRGRQGALHGRAVARTRSAGQGGRIKEVRLPDQQWPRQPRLAERLLDQQEDLVMDRLPYPYIQMNPDDMKDLGLSPGDLVEVYNDNGATQAMAYPTPTAKHKQTFMLFAFPTGVQGNVVSPASMN